MDNKPLVVFVSNYINHHQIPFCNEMDRLLRGRFAFIQTQPVEQERIDMGWRPVEEGNYLHFYYHKPQLCREMIRDAKVMIFGGCEDESYAKERLEQAKPVIRISERLYRGGQWKAISPRGLKKKYEDHVRYRKSPVYLLCAGAYVPSDFNLIHAYPGKMLRWGYFTEVKHYDINRLLQQKGYRVGKKQKFATNETVSQSGESVPYLLWAARMIDLKHPEYAVRVAQYLKQRGIRFHLDMIGDGQKAEAIKRLVQREGLTEEVGFLGYRRPEQVREYMEKADIFLFTSDRNEGWGAVANESMNSGCALVAGHMIGSIPFLIRDGINGRVYRDGHPEELCHIVEELIRDTDLRRQLGRAAYETITGTWNAEYAAARLLEFCVKKGFLEQPDVEVRAQRSCTFCLDGPCTQAPVISERGMYSYMKR